MTADWGFGSSVARSEKNVSAQEPLSDVCLFLEGSYPFVVGGVSSWTHSLIREHPELTFSILAIQPRYSPLEPRYERPENVVETKLIEIPGEGLSGFSPVQSQDWLADTLERLIVNGHVDAMAQLARLAMDSAADTGDTDSAWTLVRNMYQRLAPDTSFQQFFWIWSALFGSLREVLASPLPKARLYHTISTGYAGLLAARAKVETGAPMLLTEHGLYTHERFVELMSSDDLHDCFKYDPLHSSDRREGRDVWLQAFESMAQICYAQADKTITLSEMGHQAQIELGAAPDRAMFIPNGINVDRFASISPRRKADPPRIGFIGRVVAIKDVETFIRASGLLVDEFPTLEAWIIGPTEEEPEYDARCRALVTQLGLENNVIFKGMQDVSQMLGEIDLMVLTSLSEAQPLTLLEAGAAGVPCIATDVGSCREIILGGSDEKPRLGPGGMVTQLIAPDATAAAIATLLGDRKLLRSYGRALKRRVLTYYRQDQMIAAYRALYQSYLHPERAGQSDDPVSEPVKTPRRTRKRQPDEEDMALSLGL